MVSSPSKTLTIGSRGSQLALWQANHISSILNRSGVINKIQIIKTTGDHLQTASLVQAGGKGLFTKEIEDALLAGTIDLAVHSLKDLPTEMPEGLALAAIPEREDPRDALVGRTLDELPTGATVGTSSLRRSSQLRILRPDLRIEPVRGNVDTRLRKLREGQFDALLLAAAGLRRLGLDGEIASLMPPEEMCPAPGQGALAIQTRVHDEAFEICKAMGHAPSFFAVSAERAALAALGGGCQLPIGAFAEERQGILHLSAVVVAPNGTRSLRAAASGPPEAWQELGLRVAQDLRQQGAGDLLATV
jgi:hydroxymethylbilane synthase